MVYMWSVAYSLPLLNIKQQSSHVNNTINSGSRSAMTKE